MTQPVETTRGPALEQPAPLRLTRVLHARRETVFRAWTAAEHVKQWFSPETYTTPDAIVEPRAGGRFEVCMRAPDGLEHWSRGTFLEVTPPSRLVFAGEVATPDGRPLFRAVTEVTLSDALGGTQVDVVQTYTLFDPAAAAMTGGAQEGWRTTLNKLERVVVRLQGGSETTARSVVHATFHLERTYDAPAARVWKALTDPAAKQAWFGGPPGGDLRVIERHMDVRVGGTERLKGQWGGGMVSSFDAVYHDVIDGERLVYSYVMHLDEKKISVSLATMQLRAEGAKTTLLVTEQGAFLDGYDDAGAREHGTGLLLDALGASLKD